MKPVTLNGERIVLRPLRVSDAKVLVKYVNDSNVNRYLCNIRPPLSLKDEQNFVRRSLKGWKGGDELNWGVEEKAHGKLIGCCALRVNRENNRASFGLWIAKEFWRQGYGTEMAKLAFDYGFGKLKLNRIEYTLDTRNAGSKALIESLGGKPEGTRRQYTYKNGEYHDDYIYSILRSEWCGGRLTTSSRRS